jgi:hypothetical protein
VLVVWLKLFTDIVANVLKTLKTVHRPLNCVCNLIIAYADCSVLSGALLLYGSLHVQYSCLSKHMELEHETSRTVFYVRYTGWAGSKLSLGTDHLTCRWGGGVMVCCFVQS